MTITICIALFLSTLSLRRATGKSQSSRTGIRISIHALLAESDGTKKFKMPVPAYFYPRSPCGERRTVNNTEIYKHDISIHALLAESDEPATPRNDKHDIFLSPLSLRRATKDANNGTNADLHFYPRSPCGERQAANRLAHAPPKISIHALLAESDIADRYEMGIIRQISIHALLAESDQYAFKGV